MDDRADLRLEQSFFADPALDRVMGVAFALAGEVYVLRSRLRRLERLLQGRGLLAPGALDAPVQQPDAREAGDATAFARHILHSLTGEQQARGPA